MRCFRVVCERDVPEPGKRRGSPRKFCSDACRRKADTEARRRGMQAMVKAARRRAVERRLPVPVPSFAALCRQTMKIRKGWLKDQQAYRAGRTTPEPG